MQFFWVEPLGTAISTGHFKGQGQGCTHFNYEYLVDGDKQRNVVIAIQWELPFVILISIFTFDLGKFAKG